MSNWLVDKLIPSIMRSEVKKSSVPEGLWHKCPSCDAVLYRPELEKTLDVCPKCNHHMRIGARARIDIFLDADGNEYYMLSGALQMGTFTVCKPGVRGYRVVLAHTGRTRIERLAAACA